MKDNLHGRRPHCKTTSIKDDHNERQPQWKTTSMEDDPKGRTTLLKNILTDINLNGSHTGSR